MNQEKMRKSALPLATEHQRIGYLTRWTLPRVLRREGEMATGNSLAAGILSLARHSTKEGWHTST